MEKIVWIDSHTHMNDEVFVENMEQHVALMKENNVILANLISYDQVGLEQAFYLQETYGDLFDHSVGVHPQSLPEMDEAQRIQHLSYLSDPRVIAVGEIGLDYHWYPEHKELQKEIFIQQIELANVHKKPIMVHSRDAMKDTYDILKQHRPEYGCIMHCFSGSVEMALEFVKLGFYISLAGVLTFKNARVPVEVAKAVPLELLLIETDAPYLTPVPFRGKQNQTAYTKYVGEKLAEIKGLPTLEISRQLYKNYMKLTQRI